MNSSQPYREHLVSHQGSNIYVRHYAGTGPAFVMMHGFPDNLHIYDRLIPALPGRQVITFDFLGWGASDKPTDHAYTSKQQEGELHAVLDALQIDQVVPVAHDASGPAAINWALDHPQRVSSLVLSSSASLLIRPMPPSPGPWPRTQPLPNGFSPGRDISSAKMSRYCNPSCR